MLSFSTFWVAKEKKFQVVFFHHCKFRIKKTCYCRRYSAKHPRLWKPAFHALLVFKQMPGFHNVANHNVP